MAKVAIVVSETDTHEGLGRVVNALDPSVRRLVHDRYQVITS